MSRTPKQFSAYLVTWSEIPEMPLGATLIDKGNRLYCDWNLMDFKTGTQTSAVGRRLARLCPECRVKFKQIGILGHDGECGAEAVKDEAGQVLRDAAKRIEAAS